ncbi:MAG: TonB-dependent receptor [Planctomycetes bacterium]|nr:TonB-dependent receptor [Planctomycetota bacterium]MCB9911686.1 TonB-dependent receptor [Planctomycetota bacterium]
MVSAVAGVPLNYAGGRDQVDKDVLDAYPDKEAGSVLRRVPGVYFIPENGNDARIHIGLRGNDPRRSGLTAVLVDGIPVAEAPYGNTDIDGLPIALERVDRVDVIRGGASVRYGPNAAGGVVNFLTADVPLTPQMTTGFRVGSFGERSMWTSVGGTYGRLGALVNGVYKEGDGFRERGDYSDRDGSIKLRYALSDTEALQAYFSRFSEPHANQSGGLSQADYDADPWQSTRQDNFFRFDTNRYVVQYERQIDEDTRFELRTWLQEGTRILADVRPVLAPYTQARAQNSAFSSKAIEALYGWSDEIGGLQHTFFHSARYLQETNDELYTRSDLLTGAPLDPDLNANFEGRAFALFNEDRIALNDQLDWALGFRVESIGMSGVSNEDQNQIFKNYDVFLPETSLTWQLQPETAVYASYQQTFYPPQYETGFDPASVLYAPIDPESADAYELGLRSREIDGLEATLAAFYTHYADKIDFLNTPDGKVPINSGNARSVGVEASLSYDLGVPFAALEGLSTYATLTEQSSKITSGDNDGNDTPDAPRHLASWGLLYQHFASGLWGRLGGSYSSSSFRDAANTPVGTADGLNGPVPAFTLWDAAVGWRERADGSGFSVAVGVTNALDEDYFRRFATGIYPGAPRQYSATISYTLYF